MNLNNLVSNFGLNGNLGNDIAFLILFLLLSLVASFILGRHRLLVALLGVYASYAVVSMSNFSFAKDANTKSLFFLAILVAFVIFFSRLIRANISGVGPMLIVKLTIGSAIVIGLSLSIIFSWFSAKELSQFATETTKTYFTGDFYKFLWTIAPLVYLGIVRKRID